MNTTVLLAQVWGPVLFAVGIGVFVSRGYYVKVYRDIEKHVLAALVFGLGCLAGGTAHILAHNVWGTFTEGVVSFLGWMLFVNGVLFIVTPQFVDKVGDFWVNKKLIALEGATSLILGMYLLWFVSQA